MESLLVSKTVYELLKSKKDPDSIEAIVYAEKIEQVVTFVRKTAMDLGVMSVTDNQIMEYKEAPKIQGFFQTAHSKVAFVEGEG